MSLSKRSLRLRLVVWYGIFFLGILGTFALLCLWLFERELYQTAEQVVEAETRVVSTEVQRSLQPVSPYWPQQFTLHELDPYTEPGIVIEVIDQQGKLLYTSNQTSTRLIPLPISTEQLRAENTSIFYKTAINNKEVQAQIVPVEPPGAKNDKEQAIGFIVVAKSLNELEATRLLLRTILLLGCFITFVTAVLGIWWIASRVLTPLAELVTTARAVASSTASGTRIGTLTQRVQRPGGQDEMVVVVDAFNEMLADLRSASQVQRRFIADASHELRAPLTTIQGNLAFLRRYHEQMPAEEKATMLADAYSETLRLHKLVEELLFLARADASADTVIEKEDEQAKKSVLELDHILLQLLRQLRTRLQSEGGAVRLEVGKIEPVRIQGSEEAFRRIALILLDNAIKYTPQEEGNEPGCVHVSLECIDQKIEFSVKDNGIGIAADDIPHLFERFYRADRARARGGTGLGLAIAHTLVEQLGGSITVESAPGQGSIFTVILPMDASQR